MRAPHWHAFAPPDPQALLRALSRHIDDAMIAEIAAADYGRDIEEHLIPLRAIRDHGEIPSPLQWEPKEVLELIRWSEPDDPEWGPGGHGRRGHWMRAFCCAVLLRAGQEKANLGTISGQNQTLVQLIDSLQRLECGLDREAAGLMTWIMEETPSDDQGGTSGDWRDEDLAFFGVGLLWFALHLEPSVPDAEVLALCEWICVLELRHNQRHNAAYGLSPGRWLLSTTHYNLCHDKWRKLGGDLDALDLTGRSGPGRSGIVVEWVKLIASELRDD